ncbi:MAG: multidrug ABC transporter ATP-binding protein [Vicingaceae bacterium]|nr:MAG: multidrug ABC transporter ATP-binding protein [Vicingaceae bacterium]
MKQKERINTAGYLYRYLRPHIWKFIAGLLFLMLTGATALIFPKLMGDLINAVSINATQINRVGLMLMVLFLLQSIFSYFRVVLFVNVTENMSAAIRKDVFGRLLTLPVNYFQNKKATEINARLSADITQIHDTFTTNLAEFLRQFIIIIGGLIALFLTSVKLSLLMLLTIPVVAILAVVFGRKIRHLSRTTQDELAKTNTFSGEVINALPIVKSFTNELFEQLKYAALAENVKKMAIKTGIARGAFFSFIIFCLFGSIVLLVWYAMHMQLNGEMTQGDVIKFILYTMFVGASIGGISEQYTQIQKALGAVQRIFEILQEKPEERLALDSAPIPLKGAIEFKDVSFYYPSRPGVWVLNEVTFDVKPGQMLALVGSSGSGKSTIAQLILQFFSPIKGNILYDKISYDQLTLKDIRHNIAYVPQEVFLFSGTIKDNIQYGNPRAGFEEIVSAAKMANAHDFIMELPEKYDTQVGERGVQLSGGQRQRLAIARALLKNPSILLLDEATSALDSESEKLVQEALERLMKGRTSIVIAHRLSTIKNADKIIVLDKGKVVESGTHDRLIQKQGVYYKLYMLQELSYN